MSQLESSWQHFGRQIHGDGAVGDPVAGAVVGMALEPRSCETPMKVRVESQEFPRHYWRQVDDALLTRECGHGGEGDGQR